MMDALSLIVIGALMALLYMRGLILLPDWLTPKHALPIAKYSLGAITGGYIELIYVLATVVLWLLWKKRWAMLEAARHSIGMRVASRCLQSLTSRQSDDLRKHFRQVLIDASKFGAHTHPEAASTRTWANNVLRQVLTMAGLIPYSVSMSTKDMRDGLSGSRYYYTAKDFAMPVRSDKLGSKHAYMLIDVDYYVDMPRLLDGHAAVIYTFSPLTPGGRTTNGTYSITDDTVTEKINGGAEYTHKLWDYDHDCIIVDHWGYSVVYLVEQRRTVDHNRKLVVFSPIAKIYGFGWLVPGARLKRRDISHGQANYMRYQQQEGKETILYHAMSFAGASESAVVDDRSFETILHRMSLAKAPQISDVERILNQLNIGDSKYHAAMASILIALWKSDPTLFKQYRRIQTCGFETDDAFTYQTLGPLVTEDGTPSMRQVGPAYLEDGYAPARSYNNDNACVNGRIVSIANTVRSYPPFMLQCFQEFVRKVVPDEIVGIGAPVSADEVEAQQLKPRQKAKIEQNRPWAFGVPFVVKAFQKAEAYAKITDPRNISTVPTDHNVRLSSFTYAIAKLMKQQHWYAFGKHPREFTEELRRKAATAAICIPSDISRLDGSCGSIHSQLVQSIFARYFADEYRSEAIELLEREHNAKGITKYHVKYNTGQTTISGSPVTSIRNTLINAFHCYYALRMVNPLPSDAYDKLGLYGGDDGCTFDIDPSKLEASFKKAGLTMKAELVPRGHPVKFLGRVYIDLWTTDESCCDVPRQIRKIGLSATPATVPNALVLRRRALGYLTTDPNTPFITPWAKAVLRLTDGLTFTEQQEALASEGARWFEQFDSPFVELTELGRDYATSLFATEMQVSVQEIERFELAFETARTLTDLDIGKLHHIRAPAQISAAIRGNIVRAAKPTKK
jgi:hypothetical protein